MRANARPCSDDTRYLVSQEVHTGDKYVNDRHRIGRTYDNYQIVALVGQGGMGTVYRAVHGWTQREVALKFLRKDLARDAANVSRFMKEARAAASLRHPCVVDVLHMGQQEGEVFMVLEFLRGQSLRKWLHVRNQLSLAEALTTLRAPMEALAEAHERGLVHRDVKPDNLFICQSRLGGCETKLLDFGVAKLRDTSLDTMTATGALLGTPQYMSPEQANGEPDLGPQADVWSMGMVFFECLAGRLPFADCPSLPAFLLRLVSEDVPPVERWAAELTDSQARVIARALQRSREERFQTMAEFLAALQAVCSETVESPFFIADMDTLAARKARRGQPIDPLDMALPESEGATSPVLPSRQSAFDVRWSHARAAVAATVASLGVVASIMAARGTLSPLLPRWEQGGQDVDRSTEAAPAVKPPLDGSPLLDALDIAPATSATSVSASAASDPSIDPPPRVSKTSSMDSGAALPVPPVDTDIATLGRPVVAAQRDAVEAKSKVVKPSRTPPVRKIAVSGTTAQPSERAQAMPPRLSAKTVAGRENAESKAVPIPVEAGASGTAPSVAAPAVKAVPSIIEEF